MGETVLLYSAAAILTACVAAMGFKIANESEGGISINKMVDDLAKSVIPGFKVIVGLSSMGLVPGLLYAYMQVVNGKTSVPQSLISWIQNWLSDNGAYNTGGYDSGVKEGVPTTFYGSSYNTVYGYLVDAYSKVGMPSSGYVDVFNSIVEHYSLQDKLDGRYLFQLVRQQTDYRIAVYERTGVPSLTPSPLFSYKPLLKSSLPSSVTYKYYGAIRKSDGTLTFRSGALSDNNMCCKLFNSSYTWIYFQPYVDTELGPSKPQSSANIISNYGHIVDESNETGFEAGENVPGKDVIIPGEGTGDLTNEDIIGWLNSAVGEAVASALGIGTATVPFVPVAVKNPAITGEITDVLDNVIEQNVAQEGATDIDTVTSGEHYANTSLAPGKPSGNISASSLYTIWNPSQSQLNSLASFLWSTNFVDTIKKILQSPMDALISLALFPITPPTDGTHNISLGYVDSGVAARRVSDQFMTFQTTGLVVPHKYNSYLDYAPYTKAEIFLPFIGFCPLNINDIMGKSVDITYNIDLLSGACTAIVHANAQSLYSYSGNMAMFLPLSAGNWARMLTPIFGMIGGVTSLATGIGGVMGGAPLLASTATAVRGAESIGNLEGNSVSRSGSISGNAGIMGDYQPFIVVTRPINDKPTTYDSNIGQTYNKSAQLGTLSGFTIVDEAHVEGLSATETEKNEIESLLKEGVIL